MKQNNCNMNNIYRLEGTVPIGKAIPFGLPIVMGVSFTFVTVLSTVSANYGYPAVVGAVLIGGIFEGTLGLFAKYWRKIIAPVVAASVVTAIGYSLFSVGARSFGGGYADDFGSASNLLLGTITLAVCIIFLVSAAETIGDTSAMVAGGLMPPVGNFFASLPESVLGGCTIMMFGTIMTSGVEMIAKCGFTQRNITIVALSLAIGIGFTAASEEGLWNIFPSMVQDVFASNVVAVVFVVAVVLNLVLPANMDIHHENKK